MTRLSIKNKIFEIFHVAGKLNEVVSDLSAPKTPPSGLVPAVYSAL